MTTLSHAENAVLNAKNALDQTSASAVMLRKTESSVMMKWVTQLASAPQDSLQPETDLAFKTDALLILTVKFATMLEESQFVSNVSPPPTEFCNSHNINASAGKVSMMMPVSANPALQDVPSAQMPQFAKDAPSQLLTTTTDHVPALKATSSLLNH